MNGKKNTKSMNGKKNTKTPNLMTVNRTVSNSWRSYRSSELKRNRAWTEKLIGAQHVEHVEVEKK
jgi:hypothetical protein